MAAKGVVPGLAAPHNYGWNLKEGTFCFDAASGVAAQCPSSQAPGGPSGETGVVLEIVAGD